MFERIIRRKAFLERRVHRFLRDHAIILLPPHRRLFFEQRLYLNGLLRKVDFILEREEGFPAWLVELESPATRVFRKNGELTAEANHAIHQVVEWEQFIQGDAATNASGDMAFLAGPRQRVVVIGRGLEFKEQMQTSGFGGTVVYTYEMLAQQARERWNRDIGQQRRLVGLPDVRLF